MNGFFMLLGHMLGDYVVQNDWMARWKVAKHPGDRPGRLRNADGAPIFESAEDLATKLYEYDRDLHDWRLGHFACTVHCLCYTLAVWACTCWWMPWWGLVICFAAHWPVDRFRLAGWWMRKVSRQKTFADAFSPPNLPWGVIAVDNVFHLLTLGLIAAAAGQVK